MEKDDLNKVLNSPCNGNLYSLSSPCSAPLSIPNAVNGLFSSSNNNCAANSYLISPNANRLVGSGQQQNYFSFSGLSDNTHRLFRASGSVGSKTYCRDMNMNNSVEPGNFSGNTVSNTALLNELQRTREELNAYKIKSSSLEENLKMMKQGYESWRKRMEEYRRKELVLEQEKIQATQERD
uniref:Uncharacterized protein n=1 Tax=Romanomermis culicivorax TaxID=13658 RepID=A0A915K9S6_ROMCU